METQRRTNYEAQGRMPRTPRRTQSQLLCLQTPSHSQHFRRSSRRSHRQLRLRKNARLRLREHHHRTPPQQPRTPRTRRRAPPLPRTNWKQRHLRMLGRHQTFPHELGLLRTKHKHLKTMNRSKRTQEAIQNPQIDILAELRYKLTGCKNANDELKTKMNTYKQTITLLKRKNSYILITLGISLLLNIMIIMILRTTP